MLYTVTGERLVRWLGD